jgi:hypothetical protein
MITSLLQAFTSCGAKAAVGRIAAPTISASFLKLHLEPLSVSGYQSAEGFVRTAHCASCPVQC